MAQLQGQSRSLLGTWPCDPRLPVQHASGSCNAQLGQSSSPHLTFRETAHTLVKVYTRTIDRRSALSDYLTHLTVRCSRYCYLLDCHGHGHSYGHVQHFSHVPGPFRQSRVPVYLDKQKKITCQEPKASAWPQVDTRFKGLTCLTMASFVSSGGSFAQTRQFHSTVSNVSLGSATP
jgi:hypothetical protein